MTDFNPGDGWRETDLDSETYPEHAEVWVQFYDHGKSRRWVREAPVPPLPTDALPNLPA